MQRVVTTLTENSISIERWLYSTGHFAKTALNIWAKAFHKVFIRALFVSLASLLCGMDVSWAADSGGKPPHEVFEALKSSYEKARAELEYHKKFCSGFPRIITRKVREVVEARKAIETFQETNPAFYEPHGNSEFREPPTETKLQGGAPGLEEKSPNLRDLLRTSDTKITPDDSLSTAPAAPDSPKSPGPINQTPPGVNNPPQNPSS